MDGWIVEKGSNGDLIFIKDRKHCIAKPGDFVRQNLLVPDDLCEN